MVLAALLAPIFDVTYPCCRSVISPTASFVDYVILTSVAVSTALLKSPQASGCAITIAAITYSSAIQTNLIECGLVAREVLREGEGEEKGEEE